MFKNSGGKLKGLAKVIFVISIILTSLIATSLVIAAISSFNHNNPATGYILVASAVGTVILGIICAWLSTISLFATGELVEDTQKIREILEYRVLGQPAAKPESYNYFQNGIQGVIIASENEDPGQNAAMPTAAVPSAQDENKADIKDESEKTDTADKAATETPCDIEKTQTDENSEIHKMYDDIDQEPETASDEDKKDGLSLENNRNSFKDGWVCSSCGSRNSRLVSTCMSCGEKKGAGIRKECPNCKTQARPGEMYCRNCGTKL